MRISKDGNSVYLEVGFWLQKDGSIQLASNDPDVKKFHVTVNEAPERRNGHPTLYRRLIECLQQMGPSSSGA